jgi:hypothetical protein
MRSTLTACCGESIPAFLAADKGKIVPEDMGAGGDRIQWNGTRDNVTSSVDESIGIDV